MEEIVIRLAFENDKNAIKEFLIDRWGSTMIGYNGVLYDAGKCEAFIAFAGSCITGLLTMRPFDDTVQILTLDSAKENRGTGTALLEKVEGFALENGYNKLLVSTTNNNIRAYSFYQKRGFMICDVRLESVKNIRKLKPEVPVIDESGVSIRDEIDFMKRVIS